jgi:hypothetical protein
VLDDVILFVGAAQILLCKVFIGTFMDVVHPPIEAVDIQVRQPAMRSVTASQVLQIRDHLILNELRPRALINRRRRAAVRPGVVALCIKYQCVELVRRTLIDQCVMEEVGV